MHDRRFNPAEAHKLEDPQRLEWMPPAEVIRLLGVRPGMVVADIGAGTGFFAIPISRAVRPSGRVLAVDIEPQMLEMLREKLRSEDAGRIEIIAGTARATGLPGSCCDVVLLANVWHEFDEREEVLAEMRRILRPGGRVAIFDWRPGVERPPGPPLEHRISPEEVSRTLTANGWSVSGTHRIGPYSYLVIAEVAAKP